MLAVCCHFLLSVILFLSLGSIQAIASNGVTLVGEVKRIAAHGPFVECAMAALNRDLHLQGVPWERAQHGTENGIYDGFFMATQNHTRDYYATLSDGFFNIEWVYVVKKGSNITPDNLDFFKNSFTSVHGSARLKWLKKKFDAMDDAGEIFTLSSSNAALRLLDLGRANVSLENNKNLAKAFVSTGINPVDFDVFVFKKKPVGVYFSNRFLAQEPTFLAKFNVAVKGCRLD